MRTFPALLLAVCLLLVPALRSNAQYSDDRAPKVGFKVGVYSASDADFVEETESLWRYIGAEYSLSIDKAERPTLVVGVMGVTTDTDNVEVSMFGLQCEKRWYASPNPRSSLYYGAGLGYYLMEAKERRFEFMDWRERSGGEFGMTAVAGYQFQETAFAEVRYNYTGEIDEGLDYSGLNVSIGMRMVF